MNENKDVTSLQEINNELTPTTPEKRIITAADVTIKDPNIQIATGDHPFPPPTHHQGKLKSPNLLKFILIGLVIALILFLITGYIVFNAKTKIQKPLSYFPFTVSTYSSTYSLSSSS